MELKLELSEEVHSKLAQKASSEGFNSAEEMLLKLIEKEIQDFDSEKEKIAGKLESLGYM